MIHFNPANPKGIVWLASYPKSGNTWLRAFLYVLLRLMQARKMDAVDLDEVAYFGGTDRAVEDYLRHLSDSAAIGDPAAVAAARPRVQADVAMASPGPVLIKTHNAMIDYLGAPLINRSVSAGAVYLIRNPLDVVVSLAHFHAIPIDAAIERLDTPQWATRTNSEDVYFVTSSWSENVRSWTARPSAAVLAVRFEDMLARPLETFTAIARHVAMPGSPDQIARAVDLTSFNRLQAEEAARGFIEKAPEAKRFFRDGTAGQWRAALSAEQVSRVVARNGEEMARFGYLPA